jgi:hypothetical protein
MSEFELSIRLSVDAGAWIDSGKALVDNRKKHPLSDRATANLLADQLTEIWRGGNKANVRARLETLLVDMQGTEKRIDELLLSHATGKQFFDWFFSIDHLSIVYALKYGKTDLQALSPGTRGIVLLMLYLRMDTQDRRPLIIDQPEGNLDSASIYRLLVPFLREAKRGRQIILVTHNPNLVVATDADQVIVADMERKETGQIPELSYYGGALEDATGETSTRQTVCRILEGGAEAFKTRETRYAIPGRLPAAVIVS